MNYVRFAFIVLLLFGWSCKTTEKKLECLAVKNQEWNRLEVYKEVRNELKDSLQNWIDRKTVLADRLATDIWKIDEVVFFNSTFNRAVLLVLRQDTAQDAKMDNVEMVYATAEGSKWRFFYASMPVMGFFRYNGKKKDPTTPYSFQEMADYARRRIVEGGYFKKWSCEINDGYVNDWYNNNNNNLEESHKDFLRSKQ